MKTIEIQYPPTISEAKRNPGTWHVYRLDGKPHSAACYTQEGNKISYQTVWQHLGFDRWELQTETAFGSGNPGECPLWKQTFIPAPHKLIGQLFTFNSEVQA